MTATQRTVAAAAAVLVALNSAQSPARFGPALSAGSATASGRELQVSVNLCSDLNSGWRLGSGESLFAALGGFRLVMQNDGNLVFYAIDYTRDNKAIWQSKTYSRVDDIPVAK
jgi:hypothetical protein